MIKFSVLSDSAVKLTFDGNSHYLQDGEITVPKNSLALVKDESELITFIKAATGDAYLSFHIEDTNFANYTELENWYKTNMVSAYGGGGGGGGVTSGEVQTMIDNSISGKANTSDVTSAVTELNAALSGETTRAMASEEALSGAVSAVTDALEDKVDVSELEEVELAVAQSINVLAQSVSGKQDTLVAGSGITISGNVISADGGGGGGMSEDDELLLATALVDLNDRKMDTADAKTEFAKYQKKGDYVTSGQLDTRLADYETALDEQNVEEVTSYALNDLNERLTTVETALGGLSLSAITQSQWVTISGSANPSTIYIITNNE